MTSQVFPRTGRISGLEVGDGARLEVPTTYLEKKEKKTKRLVFYEALSACTSPLNNIKI